jgi:hypothetical protein
LPPGDRITNFAVNVDFGVSPPDRIHAGVFLVTGTHADRSLEREYPIISSWETLRSVASVTRDGT